jgi:hypothetical protein
MSCSASSAAEGCDTGKTQVERFRSGGSENLIVDARLMLAFTSEAPN